MKHVAANGASIILPGSKRTDFPDGSQLIEGANGEKYIISETGAISGNVPELRRVGVHDLALVTAHQINQTQDTVSHTLHFVGGGSFSFLHHRDGHGMSIEGKRIAYDILDGGMIVVQGTKA